MSFSRRLLRQSWKRRCAQRAARALGLSEREVTTSVGSTRSGTGPVQDGGRVLRRIHPRAVGAADADRGGRLPGGGGHDDVWRAAGRRQLLRRSERTREVQAYVALGTSQSAIAICCGGTLLCARDLDWGHAYDAAGEAVALERDDLADKLSLELRHSFLYLKQDWDEEVSRVLLLGDMPEIRSLTVPMIERLNIEVEPLDTLSGYDLSSLPPRFSDQAAAFRLASGIVAAPSPSTLLRAGVEGGHVLPSAKWIVAGTAAAVVALLAFLYIRSQNEREEAQRSLPVVEGQNRPADSANEPEPRIRPEDMAAATIDDQVPQAPRPQAPTPFRPQSRIPDPQSQLNPVHRLTGIVIGGGRRLALIDGRVVEVGDRVETDTSSRNRPRRRRPVERGWRGAPPEARTVCGTAAGAVMLPFS